MNKKPCRKLEKEIDRADHLLEAVLKETFSPAIQNEVLEKGAG